MSDPTTRAIQQILFDDNSLRVTLKKLSEDMGGAEKAMPYVVMAFMRATLDNPIWAGYWVNSFNASDEGKDLCQMASEMVRELLPTHSLGVEPGE